MGQAAAIGVSLLGAGITASAYKRSGEAQQSLANYNADINLLKGQDAIIRGREAETRLRIGARGLTGASRAAFAASGVEVNDPDSTAANVQADIAALSELDALTIRSNAAREAWGYRAAAVDERARGQIAAAEGTSKAIGVLTSTAGSILYNRYGFGSTTRKRV